MNVPGRTLDFATAIAREAGAIMRENFSLGMRKEWKEDNTPLTVTDTKINQLVLDAVEKEFPEHSVLAEEGNRMKDSEYVWVCDPVDGTIPFSHGYPLFVFSLALVQDGESILGVIYDPILDRLLHAQKNKGAFLNDDKISVSNQKQISKQSLISVDSNSTLVVASARQLLKDENCYLPVFYSTVYSGMLVALGEFAANAYFYDKPWDGAAVKIIVEEAGGKVTDLEGKGQRYDKPINGFVASNGLVHDSVVNLLTK